jgi:hypothetical protein
VTVNAATSVTASFSLAAPPPSSPPDAPGYPTGTQLGTDASGVTFAFAWAAGTGATSYQYTIAFTDGTAVQQGTVTGLSLQLTLPDHSSGAASNGFVCIQSVNAAGQSASMSCAGLMLPARPAPVPVTLSVTRNGSGSGTVTGTPAGINCGATCSQSVTSGTTVTLTAATAAGSTFAGWSGACSGTGTCAVTVNATTSVTATFNTNPTPVTLLVTKTGSGSGTVTSAPSGISCGATCSQSVMPGTLLTLTATPAFGSSFAGWTGACSGTGSCAIAVNAAATATATFNLSAPSTPPDAPGNPDVIQLSADASGVTFAFLWTVATGATSYRYAIAFNDGSASQQGTVTGLSLQLKVPYHPSGDASAAFVCIQSVNAVGQTSADSSCAGLTVPARPGG